MRKIIFFLALTILFSAGVYAQDSKVNAHPLIEFTGQDWMPRLHGHVFVTGRNQTADIDVKSDLGLKDQKSIPGGNIIWHIGPNSRLRATYTYLHYTGSATLSRTIVFRHQTYSASAAINSKIVTHYFSLGWIWDFISMMNKRLAAGLVIDVKGISTSTSLSAPALGLSDSQSFTIAVPTAGIDLQYKILPRLKVYGEIDGLPAGGYGYFLDAQGGLRLDVMRNLALTGGWRTIDLKVNYNHKDSGKLTLQGPFAALTLQF